MSYNHQIEQFNIENPGSLYSKRGSGMSSNNDISQDVDSNDNIIFENASASTDRLGSSKYGVKKSFCGIRGDSEISGILNIVVSAIGGGCFSLPHIMYDGGIIVSLLIFLFVTVCVAYSIDLLRSFVVDTKYFSFALMTETILGHQWLQLYAVSSFIIYVSMEVSYLDSIYGYIKNIFSDHSDTIWFYIIYFSLSMIIEVFICFYISKVSKMHLLSILSISCFFILLISLIIFSLLANINHEVGRKFTIDNLFFPRINPDTAMNRLLKIASYLTEYVYSYSYHSTFPTLIGNLQHVTHSKTQKVHLISFGIIFGAYFLTTFFGFIMSDKVPDEMFKNYRDYFEDDWAYLIVPYTIVLCIYLLTLIPIRFIVLRDNYITLIGEKKMTNTKELIIICIFVFICNIFAFAFENFATSLKSLNIKFILQTFGGMFGVIISFCLPVVNYVSVNGKRKIKSFIGYLITGFFMLVGLLSTVNSIYQIIFGNNEDNEEGKE